MFHTGRRASSKAAAAVVGVGRLRVYAAASKSSFTSPPPPATPPPPPSSHSMSLKCLSLPNTNIVSSSEEILLPAGEKSGFRLRREIQFCLTQHLLAVRGTAADWGDSGVPIGSPALHSAVVVPHPRYHHSLTPMPV